MSANGKESSSVPGMLLRRYAEETDRNAVRDAFYGFAAGDPKTFPVRFAVLLEAHATAMETAPELLKHRLGALLKDLRDLMAAYQADMRASAEKVTQHEAAFNEALRQHRAATDRQIAELRQEVARLSDSASRFQQRADSLKLFQEHVYWIAGIAIFLFGAVAFPLIGAGLDAIRSFLHL